MLKSIASNGGVGSLVPQILKSEQASNTIGRFSDSYKLGKGFEQNASIYGRAAGMDRDAAMQYMEKQVETLGKRAGKMNDATKAEKVIQQQAEIAAMQDSLRAGGDHKSILKAGKEKSLSQRDLHAEQARDTLKEFPGMAKDYFLDGDFTQNAARIGTAAGLYMGAAAGARYVSGGGMTYNNQGQKDIAGIPFI